MANSEQIKILKQGVKAWNKWRDENDEIKPELSEANLWGEKLSEANLSGADLFKADLSNANLSGADLFKAKLFKADLSEANLLEANLSEASLLDANLFRVNLSGADLFKADLIRADLRGAQLLRTDLREADLREANLFEANLFKADLIRADLRGANLSGAHLWGADLSNADLSMAILVGTFLREANLTNCRVYGISAWDLVLDCSTQANLIITKTRDSMITVDDIEVAQFIYFMLTNKKIRRVIDTMTSKAVLILGRFTKKRKAVLDALRKKLSSMNYLPIIFDFDKPSDRDLTETVKILAGLSKFIIMDLSDPSSSPHEAVVTITDFKVPFLPILEVGQKEYAMFDDLRRKHPWVMQMVKYNDQNHLISG